VNKPIRTLAIGCLVLLILLLLNLNYVQVFRAGALNADNANKRARDAECSSERGPILVDGDPVARSVRSHDFLKYVRTYSHPLLYAPVTGFFSCLYGSTGIESSENPVLSGSDSRLFVNRVIGLVGNDQPKGGSVLLTLDSAAQRAAYNGLKALSGATRGAGPARSSPWPRLRRTTPT
jgi:penicillin-binding protein A